MRPDHLATVFAGADVEATERARAYFAPYPPSSPAVALLKDGKVVYMMERRDIESQAAQAIAAELRKAYETLLRTSERDFILTRSLSAAQAIDESRAV